MGKTLIFHVEDEPDDALFVQLAVDRAQADCEVHRVSDGKQAVDYLAGNGQFADRSRYPLPQLMLLDLKLPLFDGFEVLTWVRSRAELQDLPIVILSGSDLEKDREKALSWRPLLPGQDAIIRSGGGTRAAHVLGSQSVRSWGPCVSRASGWQTPRASCRLGKTANPRSG